MKDRPWLIKLFYGGAWSADGKYSFCSGCRRNVSCNNTGIGRNCPYCGRFWNLQFGDTKCKHLSSGDNEKHQGRGEATFLLVLLRLIGFALTCFGIVKAIAAAIGAGYSVRLLPFISVPHGLSAWSLSICSLVLLVLSAAFLVRGLSLYLFRRGVFLSLNGSKWTLPQINTFYAFRVLVAFLVGIQAGVIPGITYLLSVAAASLVDTQVSSLPLSLFCYLSMFWFLRLSFPPLFWSWRAAGWSVEQG